MSVAHMSASDSYTANNGINQRVDVNRNNHHHARTTKPFDHKHVPHHHNNNDHKQKRRNTTPPPYANGQNDHKPKKLKGKFNPYHGGAKSQDNLNVNSNFFNSHGDLHNNIHRGPQSWDFNMMNHNSMPNLQQMNLPQAPGFQQVIQNQTFAPQHLDLVSNMVTSILHNTLPNNHVIPNNQQQQQQQPLQPTLSHNNFSLVDGPHPGQPAPSSIIPNNNNNHHTGTKPSKGIPIHAQHSGTFPISSHHQHHSHSHHNNNVPLPTTANNNNTNAIIQQQPLQNNAQPTTPPLPFSLASSASMQSFSSLQQQLPHPVMPTGEDRKGSLSTSSHHDILRQHNEQYRAKQAKKAAVQMANARFGHYQGQDSTHFNFVIPCLPTVFLQNQQQQSKQDDSS